MVAYIYELTVDHLGDLATPYDVAAFQAAAWNVQAMYEAAGEPISDEQAIELIWNNGDFWPEVQKYAPVDYQVANEHWDD